jgi:hypothetical protein
MSRLISNLRQTASGSRAQGILQARRIRLPVMRGRVALALAATLLWTATAVSPSLAAAPTVSQVTAALRSSPVYIDPALHLSNTQRSRLETAGHRYAQSVRLAAVSAVPTPATTPAGAARSIRQGLGFAGTVAVLVGPTRALGVAGAPAGRLPAARAAASRAADPAGALAAFAASIGHRASAAKKSSSSSGLPTWAWILIILAAIAVVALVALRLRARSRTSAGGARRGSAVLSLARRQASERGAALGRDLAETAVAVAERDDSVIADHHRQASELVAEVRGELPQLDGPPGFRRANEKLDQAEWHLGMARAHLDGTAEPPRPEEGRPARCFFDAGHGLTAVEVHLEIPGVRTVTVGVCAEDAVRLSRGQDPDVGYVSASRREVPWAAAPTWFGGWGFGEDDLPLLRYHGRTVFPGTQPAAEEQADTSEAPAVDRGPAPPASGAAAAGPPGEDDRAP